MNHNKRYLLAVSLGIFLGGIVYVVSFAQKQPPLQPKQVSLPEVLSCVRKVRVVNRTIENAGTPTAVLAVEVENTSDIGIVALSLDSVKGKDSYRVIRSTFEADEPTNIVKPHETCILRMELSNIAPNANLEIGSATYADGSEDGCDASLKAMRKAKERHERIRAERRSSPK